MTYPDLAATTTTIEMRDAVCVALVDAVLDRHAHHVAHAYDTPHAVSPAAAVIAVVLEADAAFSVDGIHDHHDLDAARGAARAVFERGVRMIPAVVAQHVSAARRAAGLDY